MPNNPGDAVENIRTGAGPRRQAATPRRQTENDPRRIASGHGSPGENPIAAIAPGRNPRRTYILRATTHIIGQVRMDANMKEAERVAAAGRSSRRAEQLPVGQLRTGLLAQQRNR